MAKVEKLSSAELPESWIMPPELRVPGPKFANPFPPGPVTVSVPLIAMPPFALTPLPPVSTMLEVPVDVKRPSIPSGKLPALLRVALFSVRPLRKSELELKAIVSDVADEVLERTSLAADTRLWTA